MSANLKPQEPSMEEILASIRRIIADDEGPREVDARLVSPREVSPREPFQREPSGRNMPAAPRAAPSQTAPVPAPSAHPAGSSATWRYEADTPPDVPDARRARNEEVAMPKPLVPEPPAPRDPREADLRPRGEAAPVLRPAEPVERLRPNKPLLSPDVDAVVTAAFDALGDLTLPQHGRTVEDLVKEVLRPMIKDWLDAHLPAIVERLVRAEIERVSRGGR